MPSDKTKICCLIGVLFIVFSSSVVKSEELVTITGKVVYWDGTVPTFGKVTLGNNEKAYHVKCDKTGNFKVENVPPGLYELVASGQSANRIGLFHETQIVIKSLSGDPFVLNITLNDVNPKKK